ncbi:MAG: diaminopimelate epimerase [Candidatus Gastranaerophilales bacterium]|nr:diaminopimelate epimerase [Candidatus Gastranaerophilales bacterium]
MTMINFTKMHGLGNDFVVLDYEEYKNSAKTPQELAVILCDRHFGIGADGLIIINPNVKNADIGWIFYNADGSSAQMCGNGIRCFAKYVYSKGLITKKEFSVDTKAGIIVPKILENGYVKVNMSKPIFEPSLIPVNVKNNLNFEIKVSDKTFKANAVSMGNPHCIIITDENTKELALKYGREIEHNSLFPEKTNVEFIKILSRNEINLDVWERGCAITLACGTGACASVTAAILNGYCDKKVKVNLPGGSLIIEWNGNVEDTNHDIFMSGSAEFSFIGKIEI